jgi:hypothetical protein
VSYIRSTVFQQGDLEPSPHTVISLMVTDWGVAFKLSQDGSWYAAGPYGSARPMKWWEVLDAIEDEEVFLLGPYDRPIESPILTSVGS